MSHTTSPATGRPYGLKRVCAAWDLPRSSCYARRPRPSHAEGVAPTPAKRGPKTALADEELLDLIRADLEASPFHGEGHRKVWARLRVLKGVRVGRNRVLRLMRRAGLLSPHRARQARPADHDGEITTSAPNLMWGTDATRVLTAEDGYAWVFAAVEHWNAECVGWHVSERGDRYQALEPIAMGVLEQFGAVGADAARGLAVRTDHGSQYTSGHFREQLRFWGIAPSLAFVGEPQTNGVVERFFRTLREQVLDGRIYRTVEELRQTVGEFVRRYNEQWLVEKLGFQSPKQAREAYVTRRAA